MPTPCACCEDVRLNLADVPDRSRRERNNLRRNTWTWVPDFQDLLAAILTKCEFCSFVDHLILEPWYNDQKYPSLAWDDGLPEHIEYVSSDLESGKPFQWQAAKDRIDRQRYPSWNPEASKNRYIRGELPYPLTFISSVTEVLCFKCGRPGHSHYECQEERLTESEQSFIQSWNKLRRESLCKVCEKPVGSNTLLELFCTSCKLLVARYCQQAVRRPIAPSGRVLPRLGIRIAIQFRAYSDESINMTLTEPTALSHGKSCMLTAGRKIDGLACKPLRDRSFSSARCFEQIRSWIAQCRLHGCIKPSTLLPTRVLDVDAECSSRLRLVETKNLHGQYLALSYCWGGPQEHATTSLSLLVYLLSIEMNDLPATIQDAIVVARKLEFRYLWVDSMCILQDSHEDKAKEIAAMDDTYTNAFLTISASRASACTDGFLTPLRSERIEDVNATIELQNSGMTIGEVLVRRQIWYDLSCEPISKRAWTYQERVLAPRILSFGSCLTWMCAKMQELDPCTGDSWTPAVGDILNLAAKAKDRRGRVMSSRIVWTDFVQEYASRALSNQSDILTALAGVAKRFHTLYDPGQYMAGLWRSQLSDDLMWKTDGRALRPKSWRAPSWSWASLVTRVTFWMSSGLIDPENMLLEVCDCKMIPSSDAAPFGELKDSYLTVAAQIGRTTRTADTSSPTIVEVLGTDETLKSGYYKDEFVFIDVDEDRIQRPPETSGKMKTNEVAGYEALVSTEALLLPIRGMLQFDLETVLSREDCITRLEGLIIAPVEGGSFRRVGIFAIDKFDPAEYITWTDHQVIRLV